MIKPYYSDKSTTLYNCDARLLVADLDGVDAVITDPIWPNNRVPEFKGIDGAALLGEILEVTKAKRVVIQYGCDSDPRCLVSVPPKWPFFRVCWLEYACPTRKGRVLYTGDVAYAFGIPVKSAPGRRVISGKYISTKGDYARLKLTKHKEYGKPLPGYHPTPRRLQHVRWLINRFTDGIVLDPFCGSGTTLLAARSSGYQSIGIEINERFCEIAAKRLDQSVFEFDAVKGVE